MEKERRIKTLSVVALIIAVLGLTIAFAALSTTLTINGRSSIDSASWDVHFSSISDPVINGDARVVNPPTLSGTEIKNFQIVLTKPGDSIHYDLTISNDGTIDAIFEKELNNGIVMDDENITEEDVLQALRKMIPKFDIDGDGVTTDEELFRFDEFITLDVVLKYMDIPIEHGQNRGASIDIKYLYSADELPKGEVVLNLDIAWVFVQK